MAVFFTSDLHLGHHRIQEYCERPFADVDEMNAALIDNWNRVVERGDDVFVVGDFALGNLDETLSIAGRLNGTKVLVAGNHDRCWFGHGKRADGWEARYLEAGFAQIVQGTARVKIGKHRVVVSHFPYEGDHSEHDRYVEHRPVDKGGWLIHGHAHTEWAQRGRMMNVGVDTNDFTPVSEATILGWIKAGPADRQWTPS